MKLNQSVTSQLPAGTAWVAAKRYKDFQIHVKYVSKKQ
jgi:hypothetical protein